MSKIRAKKYANAILSNSNVDKEGVLNYLLALNGLIKEDKFKEVLLSPLVNHKEKESILLNNIDINPDLTDN